MVRTGPIAGNRLTTPVFSFWLELPMLIRIHIPRGEGSCVAVGAGTLRRCGVTKSWQQGRKERGSLSMAALGGELEKGPRRYRNSAVNQLL